jgi:23S rRNA (adenine2503-C2)-methyltransferase
MLAPAVKENSSQFVPPDASGHSEPGLKPLTGPISSNPALFGLDAKALAERMASVGEPAWRGRQLAEALYRQRIAELDAITTLPKSLRQRLIAAGWRVGRPKIAQAFQSVDGTERYLVECQSGEGIETVETVWMPEGDGGETGDESDAEMADESATLGAPSFPRSSAERVGEHKPQSGSSHGQINQPGAPGLDSEIWESTNPATGSRRPLAPPQVAEQVAEGDGPHRRQRATLCVSSQVGCAVNCQFCLTAQLGFQRNLTAGEIAGQVVAVLARHAVEVGRDRVNLVFMGMGEPLLNYDNFMAAVRLLVNEAGLSPQRMTVSTAGIVPGIERFTQEPPELRPRLALSLNAPNDRLRDQLMPLNRQWPIAAVIEALRQLRLRSHERITFEYVLLGGLNDRPADAAELARLVRRTGLPVKVNLIAWNPGPDFHFTTPKPEAAERFRRALAEEGIPASLRRPRGREIYAACGQLKRTVEVKPNVKE